MNKRVIVTLIVLMILVMTSLILVQTNSIRKALQLREEQFDADVNSALTRVVERIESDEYNFVKENVRSISPFPRNTYPKAGISSISSVKIEIPSLNGASASLYIEERTFGFVGSNKTNERGRPGDAPNAFDIFHEQDNYLRQQYEDRLAQQAQVLAKNEVQAYWANLPIDERINLNALGRSIKAELKRQGISLEFRLTVKTFPSGIEKVVFGDKNFNPNHKTEYRTLLFPNDTKPQPNWFYIYFPAQNSFLLKETGLLVIPTFLLTAMLIGIFVYTILIILKQKKLSDIKNDFINNMTHELKTPISTISLASQMLRDNSLNNTPKSVDHISGIIYQESKRLTTQVEKVLQMAVFNEGSLKLKFKELNVNTLIETVVLNFELRVKSRNGELTSDLKADASNIWGDEVHITNVLFNLLDNAVKYSKDEPKIHIATELKDNYLVVSVKDHGIGIQSEHLNQIFERFYRVPTGNVHDVKGFGLGLSYVKKIVEVHKGKIKVESALHKGTKFMIYFPINEENHGKKSKTSVSRG
jgi:two-component system phosphate regulon sensor histidine kinase PhoR